MLMPLGVLSQYIFGTLLFTLSFLIIAIILLQRGRGGGLTGALGGLGGQSAFGVKAGDIFTRITAILVLLWITASATATWWYKESSLDIKADASAKTNVSSGMGAASDLNPPPEANESKSSEIPSVPDLKLPGLNPTSPSSVTAPAEPAPADPAPADPAPAIESPK